MAEVTRPLAGGAAATVAQVQGSVTMAFESKLRLRQDLVKLSGESDREWYVDLGRPLGAGGEADVFYATDKDGNQCAARVSEFNSDHFDLLRDIMRITQTRPVTETHLMPLLDVGTIRAFRQGQSSRDRFAVEVMPICTCLGDHPCQTDEEAASLAKNEVLPALAEAVKTLHANGIIHRDVTPNNVYRCDGVVVLGDFGISGKVGQESSAILTVYQRGTPGYTAGGSAVVPGNDWFSLGYTVWTMYRNGGHPMHGFANYQSWGNVQMGLERPVDVPMRDGDETFGMLLQGLTYYNWEGRLGYNDIIRWRSDPSTFSWTYPSDARINYEFEGRRFNDVSQLARAMGASWNEGITRLYQGDLGRYFERCGLNDLQSRMHTIVEDDSETQRNRDLGLARAVFEMSGGSALYWQGNDVSLSSLRERASRGGESPDGYMSLLGSGFLSWAYGVRLSQAQERGVGEETARLTETFRALEGLVARQGLAHFACLLLTMILTADRRTRDDVQAALQGIVADPNKLLALCSSASSCETLLAQFCFGGSDVSVLASAHEAIIDAESGAVDLEALLSFLDKSASDQNKRLIRSDYRMLSVYAPWLWLAEHAGLYRLSGEDDVREAIETLAASRPSPDASVDELRDDGARARPAGVRLRESLEATPVPYALGWDSLRNIRPTSLDALFTSRFRGERVPRGFVRELLGARALSPESLAEDKLDVYFLDTGGLSSEEYRSFIQNKETTAVVDAEVPISAVARSFGVAVPEEGSEGENEGEGENETEAENARSISETVDDLMARILSSKKLSIGVMLWYILLTVIFFSYLVTAFTRFSEVNLIMIPILALFAAYVLCFGFLGFNFYRLTELSDRVSAAASGVRNNEMSLESTLSELEAFDHGRGRVVQELSDMANDRRLDPPIPLFYSLSSGTLLSNNETLARRIAPFAYTSLVVLVSLVAISAFIPGLFKLEFFSVFQAIIAVVGLGFLLLLLAPDEVDPGSRSALLTWLWLPFAPIIVVYLSSALAAIAVVALVIGVVIWLLSR